jgi:hypothetical protein
MVLILGEMLVWCMAYCMFADSISCIVEATWQVTRALGMRKLDCVIGLCDCVNEEGEA